MSVERNFQLSEYDLKTYTLIYLISQGMILLLQRADGKSDMAGKITGLGGKIEQDESLLDSAKREFYEESGLRIHDPELKGTFQWLDESKKICMTHIIFASQYSGELLEENREGILAWYLIEKLQEIETLAQYQMMFLPYLLEDSNHFYSGIGEFENEELIDYIDSKGGKNV
ncbi:NUDIX domain-containing protein [Candidatus Dojkabacteria bacterium]|uniref:NUDIX domain-containing protein n=1 Tax=Candidatus Dojkabacteria bacterium TaxID=2099670 RepID=A0A955L3Y7_9BACT|nr:NUDIX domain-containing protein [Candidatus Dojkabacteria bacterium]